MIKKTCCWRKNRSIYFFICKDHIKKIKIEGTEFIIQRRGAGEQLFILQRS